MSLSKKKTTSPPSSPPPAASPPSSSSPNLSHQPLKISSHDAQRPDLPEAGLIIDNLFDPTLTNQNVLTLSQILINYYAKTYLKPQDPVNQKITQATNKFLDDRHKTRLEYASRELQHTTVLAQMEARRTSWPEMATALSYETLLDLSNVERFFLLKESLSKMVEIEKVIQARYKALLGLNGIEATQIGKMVAELMRIRAGLGYDICQAAQLGFEVRKIVIRDLMLGNHSRML